VQWGGVQVKVHEPVFERADTLAAAPDTASQPAAPLMPAGPLLFHVRLEDETGGARIDPVAELANGELRAVGPRRPEESAAYIAEFVARYYARERPYALFRGDSRVGTFYVREPSVIGAGLCPELAARGVIELRPPADTLSEFLAWPPEARRGVDLIQVPEQRADMRPLSQVLARNGVEGQPGRWRIRLPADLRAVRVDTGRPAFAATFMVGDTLDRGSPADSAGSIFLVAEYSSAVGYTPVYFDAAWYGPGGKRSVRWVDASELLGAPGSEWLVQAYGDSGSWFELVGQQGTARAVIWSGRRPLCEARAAGAAGSTGGP
jgi:hypothetical protein